MQDFRWVSYSEKLEPKDGFFPMLTEKGSELVDKPVEFVSCLNTKGLLENNVFTSDLSYGDLGYEQFTILQECSPDGTLVQAFLNSVEVTNYVEFWQQIWNFMLF